MMIKMARTSVRVLAWSDEGQDETGEDQPAEECSQFQKGFLNTYSNRQD